MAARTATATPPRTGRDVSAELVFLTRALKAASLREAVDRLAERARAESWTATTRGSYFCVLRF